MYIRRRRFSNSVLVNFIEKKTHSSLVQRITKTLSLFTNSSKYHSQCGFRKCLLVIEDPNFFKNLMNSWYKKLKYKMIFIIILEVVSHDFPSINPSKFNFLLSAPSIKLHRIKLGYVSDTKEIFMFLNFR